MRHSAYRSDDKLKEASAKDPGVPLRSTPGFIYRRASRALSKLHQLDSDLPAVCRPYFKFGSDLICEHVMESVSGAVATGSLLPKELALLPALPGRYRSLY